MKTLIQSVRNVVLALGLHLALVPSASAGGPAILTLPVEGVTPRNAASCARLLREGLREQLGEYGKLELRSDRSGFLLNLRLGAAPVSLTQIEHALRDGPFHLDRDRLQFVGVVRVHLSGFADLEAMTTALKQSPDSADPAVIVRNRPDRSALFTVGDAHRRSTPLFTHRELARIAASQGARILSIDWGPAPSGDLTLENMAFHCRPAYGATRSAP